MHDLGFRVENWGFWVYVSVFLKDLFPSTKVSEILYSKVMQGLGLRAWGVECTV